MIQLLNNAIMKLQLLTGFIPRIVGKGDAALLLKQALVRSREEFLLDKQDHQQSEFDSLFILDRTVDLLTLMRTQLTYEGLVDELFGIQLM